MQFHLSCIYLELKVAFCKRYCIVQNNEHVYIAFKVIKQVSNKKVEIYYEWIFKLANYLQHKANNKGVLSLEPRKSKQQIEGQRKSFNEWSFSLSREKNEWKPWKTWEPKSKKFPNLPLFHMQFTRTQDLKDDAVVNKVLAIATKNENPWLVLPHEKEPWKMGLWNIGKRKNSCKSFSNQSSNKCKHWKP